jgi:hypothetical protein
MRPILILFLPFLFAQCGVRPVPQTHAALSLHGFTQWRTGHDEATVQLLPKEGTDPLVKEGGYIVAHAKFKVASYGEMSFPIDGESPVGAEASRTDLSKNKFIIVTLKSNDDAILQLRQTGVHGGVQNHVTIPAALQWRTDTIYFSEFKGGLKPLDLTDVAKFNFAFLSNDPRDGYAEIVIKDFTIQ